MNNIFYKINYILIKIISIDVYDSLK